MRKTKEYVVPHPKDGERDNRDAGKVFVLTEMSARRAEKFAVRLVQALGSSGIEVKPELAGLGMVGIFLMAYQTLMGADFEMLEPLMDEMLNECVEVRVADNLKRKLMREDYDDFEEVETIFAVRKEIVELHAGFIFADVVAKMKASAPPSNRKRRSRNTPTSPT